MLHILLLLFIFWILLSVFDHFSEFLRTTFWSKVTKNSPALDSVSDVFLS